MSESNEDNQQCFIPANWPVSCLQSHRQPQLPHLDIRKHIQSPKQLHNRYKPISLTPRTCFVDLPITRLPEFLDEDCEEAESKVEEGKPINCISNQQHIPLQNFFRDHQLVYDKMRMYKKPNFQLDDCTSRFKQIAQLSDFHQKSFKQLPLIDNKLSATHIAINDNFDSNFQCGNLAYAYKKQETMDREYFLLLENDVNTHGYTSWFFFKVRSCGKGRAYFHITNLSKSSYLYRVGFKISIFSVSKYYENSTKWFKGGDNVQMYSTNFQKKSKEGGYYNCLYFQYQFQQDQSEVYFAMSKPYTYTKLAKDINQMVVQHKNRQIQVCKNFYSISCNIIPIIILNSKQLESKQSIQIQGIKFQMGKKCIIFMARQHPGEIVGSYFMEQLMKIFTTSIQQVVKIIEKFTIIFIPMVNPDGVIHGNSRCNLSGLDLNRQWMKQNSKQLTPQTFNLRKFIWQIHEKVQVQYLIDLHGHSKKMNTFFFSNKTGNKFPTQYMPFICSKIDKRFDFGSCTFNTTADKKNTLRNQLFQSDMKNCITVQNSYFGYWQDKVAKQYKNTDFYEMSLSLIKTLHLFLVLQFNQLEKIALPSQFGFSRQEINNQLRVCKQIIFKKANKPQINEDIQSESDPQGDIMKPQQMMKIFQYSQIIPKKKSQVMKKKKKQKKIKQTEKQDDIRGSEPMRIAKQIIAIQNKNHKSQKKLEIPIPNNKKNATQQKFGNVTPKPILPLSKKTNEKRQNLIKSTVLSMNQQELQKLNKDEKLPTGKSRTNGNSFSKHQIYEASLMKANKQRRLQNRVKTDISDQRAIKFQPSLKFGNYQRLRQERLKMFLNETLSIIKVNNHDVPVLSNDTAQSYKRKNSLRSQKFLQKNFNRIPTQNNHDGFRDHLIINYNKNNINLTKEHEQTKKNPSKYQYKKQISKRKRIVTTQQDPKRYRRFENFMQNQQKFERKQSIKPECNSVFYRFPML